MLPSHGRSQRFKSSIAHSLIFNDLRHHSARQNHSCAQKRAWKLVDKVGKVLVARINLSTHFRTSFKIVYLILLFKEIWVVPEVLLPKSKSLSN